MNAVITPHQQDVTTPHHHFGTGSAVGFFGLIAACLVLAAAVIVLGNRVRSLNATISDMQGQLASATAETNRAQSELALADSGLSQVKAQLSRAESVITDLQGQVARETAVSADLKSQLEVTKADMAAQSAGFQSRLDNANAKREDLRAQLEAANTSVADQLAQARTQTADLQTRLDRAQSEIAKLEPLVLKARQMPVLTSIERNPVAFMLGTTFTLHISNIHPQALSVDVAVTSKDHSTTQSYLIEPGAVQAVDMLKTDDKVMIFSEGFDPVTLTVR